MTSPDAIRHAESTSSPLSPRRTATPVLRVQELSVRYGGLAALSEVSMQVGTSEFVGLIGPNGAGKTTLFDAISGLRVPTQGRIEFGGVDTTNASATSRARAGMRRTFQRQQAFAALSVEDNILVALEGQGGNVVSDLLMLPTGRSRERARRDRSREVMHRCGLGRVKDEPAARLPIGMLRMVEFARAIVARPKLLLLDEPTSGLDHAEVERLGNIVRETRTADQCAVLLVEHDVPFVMDLCDHVVVLELGRLLAEGPPQDIRTNEKVRAAYLGDDNSPAERTVSTNGHHGKRAPVNRVRPG